MVSTWHVFYLIVSSGRSTCGGCWGAKSLEGAARPESAPYPQETVPEATKGNFWDVMVRRRGGFICFGGSCWSFGGKTLNSGGKTRYDGGKTFGSPVDSRRDPWERKVQPLRRSGEIPNEGDASDS